MAYGKVLTGLSTSGAMLLAATLPVSAAERVRTSDHVDANFGQLNSFTDVSLAQTLCVFSSSPSGTYTVLANGNGGGGTFQLTSASSTLDYHVQWAAAPNQSSGIELQAGIPSPNFSSIATQQTCNSGPRSSATLIIKLVGSDTSNAQAGSYTGVLSIMIAPG